MSHSLAATFLLTNLTACKAGDVRVLARSTGRTSAAAFSVRDAASE